MTKCIHVVVWNLEQEIGSKLTTDNRQYISISTNALITICKVLVLHKIYMTDSYELFYHNVSYILITTLHSAWSSILPLKKRESSFEPFLFNEKCMHGIL